MNSRSQARRRKGSYRQLGHTRESQPKNPQGFMVDDDAKQVIDYWKRVLPFKPLFVYFVRECRGPVKIGKSNDPCGRLIELQCGNPRTLSLKAVILANDATERFLHHLWHDFASVSGEWFDGGYPDAIVALACETAARQVAAHRAGEQMAVLTEHIIEDVWPAQPSTFVEDGFLGHRRLADLFAAQDAEWAAECAAEEEDAA